MNPTSIPSAPDRPASPCPRHAGTRANARFWNIRNDDHLQRDLVTIMQYDAYGVLHRSPQTDPQALVAYYRNESAGDRYHRENVR